MRQYTRTAADRRGFNPYTDEQSLHLNMQEAVLTDPANAFFDWLWDSSANRRMQEFLSFSVG
jgi:hypothetical protein